MKINTQSGFTVIELMMVIVVMAVLVTVAIPSFGSFINNNRITAQANTFHSALLYARSEAVKRNTQVTLCGTSNSSATNPCGETLLRTQDSITGGTLTAAGNLVAYTNDGRLATGTSTFTFCDAKKNNDYTRLLTISPLGNPKVTKAGTCP